MLIWLSPFPSNLLSNSYLHPGAFSNLINKGKPLKSSQEYLEKSFPFGTPVQQHFCPLTLSKPVSLALLGTDTDSLLWKECLSKEQPRPGGTDSWNCIPSCETLLLMVYDYFFLSARCLFYSQWFSSISPSPVIPPAIIHYNIFESCHIVVSNISSMPHHNSYYLLYMRRNPPLRSSPW